MFFGKKLKISKMQKNFKKKFIFMPRALKIKNFYESA